MKRLFDAKDEACEHRYSSMEIRSRGGAWSSVYDDAGEIVIQKCALTGTDCISTYKFDCPRYANAAALLRSGMQATGEANMDYH